MGVTKQPDGSYLARVRDNAGKQKKKKCKTLTEANRWYRDKQASLTKGDYTDPTRGRTRFHDFAVEWAEAQDWKQTTREGFPSVLARIEKVLPERARLAQIDQLTIKRARVELAKKYHANTVNLTMKHVMAIMRAAYANRYVPHDPTINADSKRRRNKDAEKVGPKDVPTRAEVLEIWAAAPAPYRAAIALGSSGLRIGEVIGLTADRIDLEKRLVTIDRQLQRLDGKMQFTTVKGEKPRTIQVPGPVALELRRHLREHRSDGLLFVGGRGANLRRVQFYDSAWKPALVAAGLASNRYVFHGLRHFCASSMLAEGVNPVAVAGHLGDTLETLQRVYAHWMRDDRAVPAEALERILRVDVSDGAAEER
jgi:integrase